MAEKHLKRLLACMLSCVLVVFCSCTQQEAPETSAATTTSSTVPTTVAPPEPLDVVKDWLSQTFSFRISYLYHNYLYFGISQESVMTCATDGSYSMISTQKVWADMNDHSEEETGEFYYRYEDGQLICYMRTDDGPFNRGVMTQADIREQEETRPFLVGVPAITPDHLQELSLEETADAAIFTYQLSLKDVMADNTILFVFLRNAFSMYGQEYDGQTDLPIYCTLETDPETYRPRSFTLDFTEIKPLVLDNGPLSAEYALGLDLMTMTYTFDYDIPESVTIPDYVFS